MKNFEAIMQNYYKQLLSYVKSIVKNDATAQDIVQETFIAAYEANYSEQGKIFAWLKTIARNKAYRHMQRESKFAYVSLSGSDFDDCALNLAEHIQSDTLLEDALISDEGYNRILEIINKLPEQQRTVFYYRIVHQMPVTEVAATLGIPTGSVKSKTFYGLAKVKSGLKNYLIEGEMIMDCKYVYEFLYQYAKSAILPEDRANVEKHLEICGECKEIADSLKELQPHIKPAPEGMMRHYNIALQTDSGILLTYYGATTFVPNYKELSALLAERGGVIPEEEIWFQSGFGGEAKHIAEFDNAGNRIDVKITETGNGTHKRLKYTKMKEVFEYHETNSVSMSKSGQSHYAKSHDAPNLYRVNSSNLLGSDAKSGLYIAIPGNAKNVRMKQGVDVIKCGAYQFAYDDRYITETQAVAVECTFNV